MLVLKLNRTSLLLKTNVILGLLLTSYLVITIYFLSNYFIIDTNLFMGLLLAPYILIIKKGAQSFRYAIPLLLFLGTALLIPSKTFIFFTLLFGVMFLLESCIGKINHLFLFLLIIISPVFKYFGIMLGFPLRLWLTDITGSILKQIMENVQVSGNILIMDGVEFSVDPACAGIKMIAISFIIALFIMAYYQKKIKKQFSFYIVLTFLMITFVLNILCNFFRILVLVLFKIMPNNKFHDIMGIICLTLYVIIPLIYLSKYFFGKRNQMDEFNNPPKDLASILRINLFIVALIFYAGFRINSFSAKSLNNNKFFMDGFKKEVLENKITKFENGHALIYLKPMNFYNVEHNPLICWTGSGYEFKSINKERLNNIEIFTGTMEKGKDKIYTAWWFDNGSLKTISQFDWRLEAIKSDTEFCLVNISAGTKDELINETKKLLKQSFL